ncbi:YciI family protein [Methyloversatilis sp.]|uniref:YciI family protein n=1 Tax=Methyloversatilis sp. TaxID=2569862 RepID=UPI0035AF0C99
MYYALMGEDAPNSLEKRLAARPGHLARLQALQDEGRLLIAGPLPAVDSIDPGAAGYTGSLIVAEFESLESAQAWVDEDPYTSEGVFASMTVKPFRKVFPA